MRGLKVTPQFGPILAVLGTALCVCPLARAQRGSGAAGPSASGPASSATIASHSSSAQGTASSRVNLRASAASGFAHPSQWQSVSNPINRHKPQRNPNLPSRTRVTGYYLFYGGVPYWVPSDSDEAADQGSADANDVNADQTGGDQSINQSNQTPSRRPAMQAQQIPATQEAGGDSSAQQSIAEEQEAQPPLPDEGEFTLVLTDGTWIEAVAFTHSNDKIVYITAAGSRYTIAANELDSESTLRVNQERGTPLQSPL